MDGILNGTTAYSQNNSPKNNKKISINEAIK